MDRIDLVNSLHPAGRISDPLTPARLQDAAVQAVPRGNILARLVNSALRRPGHPPAIEVFRYGLAMAVGDGP